MVPTEWHSRCELSGGCRLLGHALAEQALREMQREWRQSNALPESLVQRAYIATGRCEHAWRTQRPANDWNGFLDNFREVLAIEDSPAGLEAATRAGLRTLGVAHTYPASQLGGAEARVERLVGVDVASLAAIFDRFDR